MFERPQLEYLSGVYPPQVASAAIRKLSGMPVEKLKFGDALAGLLVDGVAETPYAGSTLRMEEPNGPMVEVPFIQGDEAGQFAPVQDWFSTRTSPENMVIKTADGDISLYAIQWMGHSVKSGRGVSLGKLQPTEIVLARRNTPLSETLTVTEVRSHVDGLKEWTSFTAIKQDRETNEKGLVRKLLVEVESVAAMTWKQGEATMTLQTDWRSANQEVDDDSSFSIFEWVVLDSKFEKPTIFFDHLVEQRKVLHLLVLMFDGAIHFRKHRVRDETFSVPRGDGEDHHPFVELISRRTVREYAEKRPTKQDLNRPLVYLRQVEAEGMHRWSDTYEEWKRFILPTVGVLGRRGAFVEDVVVSLSMSLEAGGNLLGHRDGEEVTYNKRTKKPSTATFVYRCLHDLDVNWGDNVESIAGLARAAANTYNGIKHFDRGEFPDNEETYLVSLVLRQVVRLMALNLLDPSRSLIKEFKEKGALWRIHEHFSLNELRIKDDGTWEAAPTPPAPELTRGVTFR